MGEGLVHFARILLVTLPTRALLAWVYNRADSLAFAGLVHAASKVTAQLLLTPFSRAGRSPTLAREQKVLTDGGQG